MKKRNLEIKLQNLSSFSRPKASLEQYATPADIAADILFFAYQMDDVEGKTVAELGSGPGVFSIGACILNAKKIYAVEIDEDAIKDLKKNIERFECDKIEVIKGDISEFNEGVDTVFQNPPFGSQRKHADMPFLLKSLKIGRVVYTLHNAETREFLMKKISEYGKITHVKEYNFYIPHLFNFHRKERVLRKFVFFRIETRGDNLK